MGKLNRERHEKIKDSQSLILKSFENETAIGMAMAPSGFFMFEVEGDKISAKHPQFEALKPEVYHWVAFNLDKEVTAIRNGEVFDCVVKTEITDPGEITFQQQYILWGDKDPPVKDGWCELRAARIGTLQVPEPQSDKLTKPDHVVLKAIEYVSFDKYGNAHISGQRLTGLGWKEAAVEEEK